MSVASTLRPTPANARESAPIPHVRSATRVTPAATYRRAWCAATVRRVACSNPPGVKSMPSAKDTNFACARARSRDWVSAAATSSGSTPSRRSRSESAIVRPSSYGGSADSRAHPSGLSSLVSPAASMGRSCHAVTSGDPVWPRAPQRRTVLALALTEC